LAIAAFAQIGAVAFPWHVVNPLWGLALNPSLQADYKKSLAGKLQNPSNPWEPGIPAMFLTGRFA